MSDESLLKNRKFLRFWFAEFLILLSLSMFAVYFIWIIAVNYKSVFLAGMIPAFSMLGYFIILIPEGYLLDKFNRSKIIFISTIFLAFSYSLLMFSNDLILIYIVDLLSSISSSITFDAFQTITKEILNENLYGKASAYMQFSMNLSRIVGIVLGGVSIVFQKYFPYIIFSISLISIFFNIPYKSDKRVFEKYTYGDVLKFLKRFVPFLLVVLVINGLFISIDVYSSGLIYFVLKSNSFFYTLFIIGFPVGGLIGALYGNNIAKKLENSLYLGSFIFILGIFMIFISFSRSVYIDPLLTFLMGFFVSLLNIPLNAIFLKVVPNEMIGRFNAFVALVIGGAQPLMATIFSILSSYFFLTDIMFFAGLFISIISIPAYYTIKNLLDYFSKSG